MRPRTLLGALSVAVFAVACTSTDPNPNTPAPPSAEQALTRADDLPSAPPDGDIAGMVVPPLSYQWYDNQTGTALSLVPDATVTAHSLPEVSLANQRLDFTVRSGARPSLVSIKFFNQVDPVDQTPTGEEGSVTCSTKPSSCTMALSDDAAALDVTVPDPARYSVVELFYPNPFHGPESVLYVTYGVQIQR
jgi:hypothetical protein